MTTNHQEITEETEMKTRGLLNSGAYQQDHRRIGARPLGCRSAVIESALKLIRCRRCVARFCSLKAAFLCAGGFCFYLLSSIFYLRSRFGRAVFPAQFRSSALFFLVLALLAGCA